ncbi:hypothetical protein DZF91_37015 [Actinomadura logoneensis]|uniref:Uncharacterized protein n=1 Tax=Actinomadura logoneensis TaxID=2293572 RepID=A0A372J9P6_9ACTN|nr:hypothetical protein [Actinomadura logoneensis]RFU36649.1 hypothetical protein DZF91_37015 [Actinomadura logoneensis]
MVVLGTYPHRWAVPRAVWPHHFESARREIDILAYAGLFLAEDSGIIRTLANKAQAGLAVRILRGDPDGSHIRERAALARDRLTLVVHHRPVLDKLTHLHWNTAHGDEYSPNTPATGR